MKRVIAFLSSYRLMAVLITLYIVAMAWATFFEAGNGTSLTMTRFYHSWWFIALQGLMIVNFAVMSFAKGLYERKLWGVVVLHWSLAVVLAGAMVTHICSQEGVMHIREGESSSTLYIVEDGKVVSEEELPFTVRLNDFTVERYPGSMSPSYFESDVDITYGGESRNAKIFMNNIAYIGPYRLYQSSYDQDEAGTVLTVNRDMAGTVISYIGYILLLAGMIISFFDKNGRFRYLVGRLAAIKRGAALVAVLFLPGVLCAQMPGRQRVDLSVVERNAVAREAADSFAALLVQDPGGRVEPLGTYADKVMRKLHRSQGYGSLSSPQVLLGMVYDPYKWANVPVIELASGPLATEVGSADGYVTFNEMFDEAGDYKIAERVHEAYSKDAGARTKLDKEFMKLDEQVNILNALLSGRMLPMFPEPDSPVDKWVSAGDELSAFHGPDSLFVTMIFPYLFAEHENYLETGDMSGVRKVVAMMDTYQRAKASPEHLILRDKVRAELYYNRYNIFKISAVGYLAAGGALLAVLLWSLLGGGLKWERRFTATAAVVIALFFLYAAFGMGLRWYISGRAPWTNTYESMVYAGWCAVLAGLIFTRRSPVALAVATIMGGAVIMISQLNFLDPEITPLVPVLKSYWLMLHVAVVTASYGFFGVGALLGLVSLAVMVFTRRREALAKVEELAVINEIAIIIGLVLLTAGVFLGAVWANESWGRYWGWDPKETWALITMMAYAFVLHARLIPALRGTLAFSVMSIFALYTVLMTFFGVNYYLTGMHSYGSGHSINMFAVIVPSVAVIALTVAAVMRGTRTDSR
ncbi:MAG: cytochrome c biogenesis protein CcsA [Rikenellaceae bacterium]|nr:cytochrome c biogenesis protein CcsA [Rikenellaceae bacterium]